MQATTTSVVTAYAEAVLSGDVVVGWLVRLACQRHINDLKAGQFTFNERKADNAIRFFAALILPDGINGGQHFNLEPWEAFIVGSLFGWERPNGLRRFKYSYIEVARANGKSPLAGGIGLYGMTADARRGGQIVSAATTRDQARIVFHDGANMAKATPALNAPRVEQNVGSLVFKEKGTNFRPLSADASTMDGLRIYIALVDELHEHPNGEVMGKLRTGMKFDESLLFAITTAGWDRNSVCYQEHDHVIKVLEGLKDDAYFGYIATIDPEDSWTDEACWAKANPNLGITIKLDTLREECELAKAIPGQQNDFLRLRLNVWTQQANRWLSMAIWDEGAAPFVPADLAGRLCYGGLDLSSTTDLSAFVLVFPPMADGEPWKVLCWFWLPEDNIHQRVTRDRVPYDVWEQQGFISLTEGNVIDYAWIRAKVNEVSEVYHIAEIGFDPWNATQLVTWLTEDGATMVPVSQGFAALTAPTKEIEKLVVSRGLQHGGNPVLRWMASNVSVKSDPAGNVRIAKDVSTERIDGMAAMANAMFSALRHQDTTSAYAEHGLRVFGGEPEPEVVDEPEDDPVEPPSREEIMRKRYGL